MRTYVEDLPRGCSLSEVTHLLLRFIDAFNRGDQDELTHFFDASTFQWYSVGEGRVDQGGSFFVAYKLDELFPYFAARHQQRERLRLLGLEVNAHWREATVGIGYFIERYADDLGQRPAHGKGAINCTKQTISVWSMAG